VEFSWLLSSQCQDEFVIPGKNCFAIEHVTNYSSGSKLALSLNSVHSKLRIWRFDMLLLWSKYGLAISCHVAKKADQNFSSLHV
jgi:hypothetical protein